VEDKTIKLLLPIEKKACFVLEIGLLDVITMLGDLFISEPIVLLFFMKQFTTVVYPGDISKYPATMFTENDVLQKTMFDTDSILQL